MKQAIIVACIAAFTMSTQAAQAAWKLSCEDDPIEDTRAYYMKGDEVTVIGMAKPNGWTSEFVTVGFDKYPESDLVFRVDQNPAIRWPDSEAVGRSSELIEQMVKGRRLLSRYTKWPQGITVDGTDNLTGFAVKVQEMRKRLDEYATQ